MTRLEKIVLSFTSISLLIYFLTISIEDVAVYSSQIGWNRPITSDTFTFIHFYFLAIWQFIWPEDKYITIYDGYFVTTNQNLLIFSVIRIFYLILIYLINKQISKSLIEYTKINVSNKYLTIILTLNPIIFGLLISSFKRLIGVITIKYIFYLFLKNKLDYNIKIQEKWLKIFGIIISSFISPINLIMILIFYLITFSSNKISHNYNYIKEIKTQQSKKIILILTSSLILIIPIIYLMPNNFIKNINRQYLLNFNLTLISPFSYLTLYSILIMITISIYTFLKFKAKSQNNVSIINMLRDNRNLIISFLIILSWFFISLIDIFLTFLDLNSFIVFNNRYNPNLLIDNTLIFPIQLYSIIIIYNIIFDPISFINSFSKYSNMKSLFTNFNILIFASYFLNTFIITEPILIAFLFNSFLYFIIIFEIISVLENNGKLLENTLLFYSITFLVEPSIFGFNNYIISLIIITMMLILLTYIPKNINIISKYIICNIFLIILNLNIFNSIVLLELDIFIKLFFSILLITHFFLFPGYSLKLFQKLNTFEASYFSFLFRATIYFLMFLILREVNFIPVVFWFNLINIIILCIDFSVIVYLIIKNLFLKNF